MENLFTRRYLIWPQKIGKILNMFNINNKIQFSEVARRVREIFLNTFAERFANMNTFSFFLDIQVLLDLPTEPKEGPAMLPKRLRVPKTEKPGRRR